MKFSYPQLSAHLKSRLLPLYLITGNEPLLIQEAREAIRCKAKDLGFLEIERFDANKDFDWQNLMESANALSLFSNKSCIEIKLNHKPNAAAVKLFTHYLENNNPDKIIIIIAEKLDSTTQRSSWVQVVNQIGAIVTIWPMERGQFKQWVEQRLRQNNLRCNDAAVQFLVTQTEGNLLAAAQEIEKLKLLFHGPIQLDDMISAITDNARFDVFNALDTILEGNSQRIIRVLQKLKAESLEPTFLLWAITREVRSLINIIFDLKNKVSWEAAVKKYQIWEKRQPLIKKMIKQHTTETLHASLLKAEKIDQTIKGQQSGNIWNEIETLALGLGDPAFLK